MRHKAYVLNTAILVLVFASVVAAEEAERKQLRLEAEKGNASAQFNLGVMYFNGRGVPQDYVQAHKWLNLVASRSNTEKSKDSRLARDGLAKEMTAL